MFFNRFDERTREIFKKDKAKHNVLSWIIYNTNYQERYNGLMNRECYFSYSVIEKECGISHKKALRIIKELEQEGIIKWKFKSKSKYEKSILELLQKGTCEETSVGTSRETSKEIGTAEGNGTKEPLEEQERESVKELSSRNRSKNKNKYNMNNEEVEEIRNLYMGTKSRKVAYEKLPRLIDKFGKDQIIRCVERYSRYVQEERQKGFQSLRYKNESTFWNSGYMDYLDGNYEEIQIEEPTIRRGVIYYDTSQEKALI